MKTSTPSNEYIIEYSFIKVNSFIKYILFSAQLIIELVFQSYNISRTMSLSDYFTMLNWIFSQCYKT